MNIVYGLLTSSLQYIQHTSFVGQITIELPYSHDRIYFKHRRYSSPVWIIQLCNATIYQVVALHSACINSVIYSTNDQQDYCNANRSHPEHCDDGKFCYCVAPYCRSDMRITLSSEGIKTTSMEYGSVHTWLTKHYLRGDKQDEIFKNS